MKLIPVAALGLFLSITAHADLNDVVKILSANPKAEFEVATKTSNDPVEIDVLDNGKIVANAIDSPDAIVNAIREHVAATTIKSGEYTYIVNWESMSLLSQDKSHSLYNLTADIKDHQADPGSTDDMQGELSERFEVLSVVGPYVSIRSQGDDYFPGAAHPNSWDDFATFDSRKLDSASRDGVNANLLDLVDEASLVAAIKADKALHKMVKGKKATKAFKAATTVEQLEEALFEGLQGDCYSFPGFENNISSFAVYDYDAAKDLVSIRLPMGAAAHVCAADAPTIQLGLKVKPLSDFSYLLRAQLKSGDGVFMKNVAK